MDASASPAVARLVARALYAVAIRTVRAWEGFRHIHSQYLDEVLRG